MKYKLHIPFASRTDLLEKAVESVRDVGNIHLWWGGAETPSEVYMIRDVELHEPGLVSCVSLYNMCIKSSWNDDVMFLCHNDMEAKAGIAKQMLEFTQRAFEGDDKKWGLILSNYDSFSAFNMAAIRDVGPWDTMYFQYHADVDYYRTLRAAGWHELDSGLTGGVIHHGSQSVKSDTLFNYRTRFRSRIGIDHLYFRLKWGGPPGKELHSRPFENFNGSESFHVSPATLQVRSHPLQQALARRMPPR